MMYQVTCCFVLLNVHVPVPELWITNVQLVPVHSLVGFWINNSLFVIFRFSSFVC